MENLSSILEMSRRISLAMTIVLLLIAMLALVISGIGIMNIMLVSVTERTREIGIRKAIGARRQEILYQFLLEAIVISGMGALVGIALAVAIPFLAGVLAQFLPIPGGLTIPISWLSVACLYSILRYGGAVRIPSGQDGRPASARRIPALRIANAIGLMALMAILKNPVPTAFWEGTGVRPLRGALDAKTRPHKTRMGHPKRQRRRRGAEAPTP